MNKKNQKVVWLKYDLKHNNGPPILVARNYDDVDEIKKLIRRGWKLTSETETDPKNLEVSESVYGKFNNEPLKKMEKEIELPC